MATYKNFTDKLTIEEAIEIYKKGMAVQVHDGKDIILICNRKQPVLLRYK